MTYEEQMRQYRDLEEMVQSSHGYKWLLKHIDDELASEWDMFIRLSNNSEDLTSRQIKCQTLCELKDWVEETIMRGHSSEQSEIKKREKNASILQGTGA